jgi:predicted nicotinamide N-methyase
LLLFDWNAPPKAVFPLILAADVVYETTQYQPLLQVFNQMLAPDGEIWLAEPNRPIAAPFFEILAENDFRFAKTSRNISLNNKSTEISIYRIFRDA